LKGIRFKGIKANRLNKAKAGFEPILRVIRLKMDPVLARKWLVQNVEGLGMKTASHFLRNAGGVKELAIVDTHVMKFLKINQNLIKSSHHYSVIEEHFQHVASLLGVSVFNLDSVVWAWYSGIPLKEVR
jgi:N-glycosylase/DNA lyase